MEANQVKKLINQMFIPRKLKSRDDYLKSWQQNIKITEKIVTQPDAVDLVLETLYQIKKEKRIRKNTTYGAPIYNLLSEMSRILEKHPNPKNNKKIAKMLLWKEIKPYERDVILRILREIGDRSVISLLEQTKEFLNKVRYNSIYSDSYYRRFDRKHIQETIEVCRKRVSLFFTIFLWFKRNRSKIKKLRLTKKQVCFT